MKKRLICLAMAMAILLLPNAVSEGYWEASHEIRCRDHRQNCRLLQMVMMGSFAEFDIEDVVSERILSSVFPQLCQVTEDDIGHFTDEFSENVEIVRAYYYTALANCLWADIVADSVSANRLNAAQRVLLLFLDPASQPDADSQMERIRSGMTEEALVQISNMIGVSKGFTAWLIGVDENQLDASAAHTAR